MSNVDPTAENATDPASADPAATGPVDAPEVPDASDAGTAGAGHADDAMTIEERTAEPIPESGEPIEISEEAVVTLIAERDEYLDALQRLKADFANARRRSDEQAASQRQQAAADLVTKLLPVLDSADAAIGQGVEDVRPIRDALLDVLTGQGLETLDPVGELFDPERHEAVLFESGEGEQTVVETMRAGYVWNARVLRAAMVKVRG